ncbi:hypothetical protein C8R44DRAFT_881776 [Mycena epipterygia]|nr:hypothetical protein C8R44DRAFT_881776 [Mycena epipterygia]
METTRYDLRSPSPALPFPRSMRSRFPLCDLPTSFPCPLPALPVSAARCPLPPPALPPRSLLSLYLYLPAPRSPLLPRPLSVSALYVLSFPTLALRELSASPRPPPACTLPLTPCPLVPPTPLPFFLSLLLLIFIFIFALLLRYTSSPLFPRVRVWLFLVRGSRAAATTLRALRSPYARRFRPSICSFVATYHA